MAIQAIANKLGRGSCKGMSDVIALRQIIPYGGTEVVFRHCPVHYEAYVTDDNIARLDFEVHNVRKVLIPPAEFAQNL